MSHLIKKVMKNSYLLSRHNYNITMKHPRPMTPKRPPSPDLSILTQEELSALEYVIQKQEEFEKEEEKRMSEIRKHLESYEEIVHRQASIKGKIKHIDFRLCRLCFKTKFADGIGRACYECRKRVCQRCGFYTKSKWDRKKNKVIRGKWRCNMCQLKRDFFCKTGVWFHGNRAKPTFNKQSFFEKARSLETESSDTESQSREDALLASPVKLTHFDSRYTDSEIWPQYGNVNLYQNTMCSRGRRRSMPVFRTEGVNLSDNDSEVDESQERYRPRRPQRKQNKRHSRRSKYQEVQDKQDSDSDEGNTYKDFRDVPSRREIKTTQKNSSHRHSNDHGKYRKTSENYIHGIGSHVFYCSHDSDPGKGPLRRGSYALVTERESYHSSSSSLVSDSRDHSLIRNSFSSERNNGSLLKDYTTDSLSVESIHRKERRRKVSVNPNYLAPTYSKRDRSGSSESNSSARSFLSTLTDFDPAEINQIPFTQDYINSLEPREILLYRDKADSSQRYAGLGMRVTSGKKGFGGKLGAFVSAVDKNGPADSYGIKKGDQILLWNGKSLMGTTFEESKAIMGNLTDVVQLLVAHHKKSFSDDEAEKDSKKDEDERPIIISTECTTGVNPPNSLNLNKPKRRMLPKTPIEIKKEDRHFSGRIHFSMGYNEDEKCFSVFLVKAENLMSPSKLRTSSLNPIVLVHLLPNRGFYPPYESIPQCGTSSPTWNEKFNTHDIGPVELSKLSIEVTLWSVEEYENVFLGEVLIDLTDVTLNSEVITYDLQDHDENSSPLPIRKRKESASDVTTMSWMSSVTSNMDTASWSTSSGLQSSPNHNKELNKGLPDSQAHDNIKMLFMNERAAHIVGHERMQRLNVTQSTPTSPQLSPVSASEEGFFAQGDHRGSITTLVRKRVSSAVARMSNLSNGDRRCSLQERAKERLSSRSQSANDVLDTGYYRNLETPSPLSRRSNGSNLSATMEIGGVPRPLSGAESSTSFYGDEQDDLQSGFGIGAMNDSSVCDEEITSALGPAQVPPKSNYENVMCGSIRLGFTVSKGQLEIDIICVNGLQKGLQSSPPDTYVKAYLVGESKVIQKKKTHIVRGSYEPIFRRKIKYSACNIHGRAIKVVVWARHGTFDKKHSLGEAVIKLDGLDFMQHSLSWYKLFKSGATDFGSNDSMNFW